MRTLQQVVILSIVCIGGLYLYGHYSIFPSQRNELANYFTQHNMKIVNIFEEGNKYVVETDKGEYQITFVKSNLVDQGDMSVRKLSH